MHQKFTKMKKQVELTILMLFYLGTMPAFGQLHNELMDFISQTRKIDKMDYAKNYRSPVTAPISFIQNGEAYVPVKTIADATNAFISTDFANNSVTLRTTMNTVTISSQNIQMMRNGKARVAKAPLVQQGNTLYAPVSDLATALGAKVKVSGKNVIISPATQSTTLHIQTSNENLPTYGASFVVRSTKYYTAFHYDTFEEAQNAFTQLQGRPDVSIVEFNQYAQISQTPAAKSISVIYKYFADKKEKKEIDRMPETEKALKETDIDDINIFIAKTSKLSDKDLANKKSDVHEKISFVKEGVGFLPVRTIVDVLDTSVAWDSISNNVTLTNSNRSFTMSTKDNMLAFRNGKVKITKSALVLRNDTLYAPAQDLVQALGAHSVMKGEDITISPTIQSTTLLVWTNNPVLPAYGASKIVRSTKYFTAFQYNTLAEAQSALEQLQGRSDVKYVEFNEWIYAEPELEPEPAPVSDQATFRASYDPIYNASVKPAINYDDYISSASGSLSDVTVAVIDTGFGSTDPIFDGRMVAGKDIGDNDNDVYNPSSNHGTNVASMIALFSRPNVKIMPLKVAHDSETGLSSIMDINNATYYAISKNVNVINMSFGGPGESSWYGSINDAYNVGIFTVVAAGNSGVDAINIAPANIPCAVTVGAIDSAASGYPRWAKTCFGDVVDTYAPGYYLLCANNGGETDWTMYSGTSLSAPIVAGGIADILGYQMTRGKYLNAKNADTLIRQSNSGDRFNLYALNKLIPTAIKRIDATNFKIHPNPVKDELTIERDNSNMSKEYVQIIDFSGRTVINTQFHSSNTQLIINVSQLSAGVYVLKIGNYRTKFIKE